MNDQKVSKFISYILRHKPEDIGLEMDDSGWVDVSEMIEKSKTTGYHYSLEDLQRIVSEDSKGRYSFDDSGERIRANQGHSKEVNPDLQEKPPPYPLYHGTPEQFQASIIANGLNKGSRTHVHLSDNKETALSVGKRRGNPVLFIIDTESMTRDGIKFYVSNNGVWLVDYVDPKYLELVES